MDCVSTGVHDSTEINPKLNKFLSQVRFSLNSICNDDLLGTMILYKILHRSDKDCYLMLITNKFIDLLHPLIVKLDL